MYFFMPQGDHGPVRDGTAAAPSGGILGSLSHAHGVPPALGQGRFAQDDGPPRARCGRKVPWLLPESPISEHREGNRLLGVWIDAELRGALDLPGSQIILQPPYEPAIVDAAARNDDFPVRIGRGVQGRSRDAP